VGGMRESIYLHRGKIPRGEGSDGGREGAVRERDNNVGGKRAMRESTSNVGGEGTVSGHRAGRDTGQGGERWGEH
jgi:hypothetical protein